MASAIDATKPADSSPALTSDLRANLLAAKTEIEALQASVAAAGDFKSDGTVAGTGNFTTTGSMRGFPAASFDWSTLGA